MENNNNEIVFYQAPTAELTSNRLHYTLTVGDKEDKLIRDVDFGKIPNTKTPSLFKSGAEKILRAYGLAYDVIITDSYKDHVKGYFYYECKAIAYFNEKMVRVGVGCANTNESAVGSQTGYNASNAVLKKAKKRAIVDLALTLGTLSNCFTQDMEDDNNETRAKKVQSENDFINSKQRQRIFAIASQYGITQEECKSLLLSWGHEKTSEIKLADYDGLCDKLKKYGEEKDKN